MLDRAVHPNTKSMLLAWRKLAYEPAFTVSARTAPDFPQILGRFFVLQKAEEGVWPFRIAGEGLSHLFARDLREQNILGLFRRDDHDLLKAMLSTVSASDEPALIMAQGETLHRRRVDVEIALAPLDPPGSGTHRVLGLYQTLGGEPMLEGRPIHRHILTTVHLPRSRKSEPRLKLVASND